MRILTPSRSWLLLPCGASLGSALVLILLGWSPGKPWPDASIEPVSQAVPSVHAPDQAIQQHQPSGPSSLQFAERSGPVQQPPTEDRGGLLSDEQANIKIYECGSRSLVHLTSLAERHDNTNPEEDDVRVGTGSGFVWDREGHIVTNYHVVEGAEILQVVLADHSTYRSQQIWSYPDADIAVLRIEAPADKLHPVVPGNSHELRVGQLVFALGCPYGLDQTMTTGIISAVGREIRSASGRLISNVIQTCAPINPGNSGGMLLDSKGRLIGMNTAILSRSGGFVGIGFAIPIDEIKHVVPRLIRHGNIVHPHLGVQIAAAQLARGVGVSKGVLILKVNPKSPAETAGLRGTRLDAAGHLHLGDVIVALDGQAVSTPAEFYGLLDQDHAGQRLVVTFLRDGTRQTTAVTLAAFEAH